MRRNSGIRATVCIRAGISIASHWSPSRDKPGSCHVPSTICSKYLDAGMTLALVFGAVSPITSRGSYEDQHSCMVVGCRSGVHGSAASRSTGLSRSHDSRRSSCRTRGGGRSIFQLPPPCAPGGGRALHPASGAGRAVPSPPWKALETEWIPRGDRLLHRRPVL
jgi:hypothetical protein